MTAPTDPVAPVHLCFFLVLAFQCFNLNFLSFWTLLKLCSWHIQLLSLKNLSNTVSIQLLPVFKAVSPVNTKYKWDPEFKVTVVIYLFSKSIFHAKWEIHLFRWMSLPYKSTQMFIVSLGMNYLSTVLGLWHLNSVRHWDLAFSFAFSAGCPTACCLYWAATFTEPSLLKF